MEKPPKLCSTDIDEIKFKKPGDQMSLDDKYNVFNGPIAKPNKYISETEKFDQIVYLFDYIDDVFQEEMVTEFSNLLKEARSIGEEDPKKFDDPYTPEKLIFYFSKGNEGRDPWKASKNKLIMGDPIELIKKYKFDFNVDAWKQSFSASKISNIIKVFGWGMNTNVPYFYKKLIDKYDFNGNGRLDAKEFIFFAIWENYKQYKQCKQFCFKKIIDEKIDPLFSFLDCDKDGYINSENIWEGLKYLKRSEINKEKYNFYKCELPKPFNRFYRTNAANDFVLKNFNVADGYLNREEFIKGILLGYWERQVNLINIVCDDTLNKKAERWDPTGKQDLDCNDLMQMYLPHK